MIENVAGVFNLLARWDVEERNVGGEQLPDAA